MSRADSSPTPSSASSSSSSSASSSTSTYNVNASSSSRDNHLATARTECLPIPAGEQNNDDDSEVDESDIFQLVYCSSSISPAMPRDNLIDILSACRRNNAAAAISGLLMYKDGQFVQFLEGPEHRVRRIFAKINRDERHSGVYVLLEQKTNKRDFPQWSMAFRDLARSERLPPNRENISFDEKGELIKDENDAFNDIMVKNNTESTMFSSNMNYKIKRLGFWRGFKDWPVRKAKKEAKENKNVDGSGRLKAKYTPSNKEEIGQTFDQRTRGLRRR